MLNRSTAFTSSPERRGAPNTSEEMTMKPLALLAAGLAAAAVAASPAVAKQQPKPVEISYGDLDLSSEAGKAELRSRLKRAAKESCGVDTVQTGTILRSRENKQCYEDTLAALDAQFESLLSEVQKGG